MTKPTRITVRCLIPAPFSDNDLSTFAAILIGTLISFAVGVRWMA